MPLYQDKFAKPPEQSPNMTEDMCDNPLKESASPFMAIATEAPSIEERLKQQQEKLQKGLADNISVNVRESTEQPPKNETLAFGAPSNEVPPEIIEGIRSKHVVETKECRVALDVVLQTLKNSARTKSCKNADDPRRLAMAKITEAVMWLGMDLKALKEDNPYPDSYDPSNTKIAPTADGLKL